MTTHFTTRDGVRLAYVDEGRGLPVLWQHGLGADRSQPAEVFPCIEGIRRITLECRGHGASALGNTDRLTIEQFAHDALALLDHLNIEQAVVGGISLGAAIALRLAALYPGRARALILARPAWLDEPGPEHLRVYRDVALLLAEFGADEGQQRLNELDRMQALEAISADNAASMRSFFTRANPASTIALLTRIPTQGPGVARADIGQLAIPALVIGHGEDYVHALDTARTLADWIPHAQLRVITSKTVDRTRYVHEFQQAVDAFLESLRNRS
ncbi:MAG TPA: alpha/beta hydrolase [Pararobbsia sp.]|nr:alpha/beta hydrolase [Pararobbsia sp.]